MSGPAFLDAASLAALVIFTIALLVSVVRLVLGPSLPDRVLALDLMGTLAVGYVGVVALRTGFSLYVDIAIALALAGFVSTVALARFVLGGRGGAPDAGEVLHGDIGKETDLPASRWKDEERHE
jgi:multicomponent Na+:H+ antiporter subunit F